MATVVENGQRREETAQEKAWREACEEAWSSNEISRAITEKQAEITNKAEEFMAQFMSEEYGPTEIATWDQQYAEALDIHDDSQTDAPLVRAISAARNMDAAELAERIINNRAEWAALCGHIVGQRLSFQDQLDNATTIEEAKAIKVVYSLP